MKKAIILIPALCSLLVFSLSSRAGDMKLFSPTLIDLVSEHSEQLELSEKQVASLIHNDAFQQTNSAIEMLDRRALKNEVNTNDYILELDEHDKAVINVFLKELNGKQLAQLSSLIWQELGVFSFLSREYSEAALGNAVQTREYHQMRYDAVTSLIQLDKDLASRRFVNEEARRRFIDEATFKIEEAIKNKLANNQKWK
ncbi:hypothetical protein [Curvivirga sp.]|uniref:hypothetical protein n=1 Tax=Curvivirga sp. TaxID=2856848 RepID=UPI003B5A80F3